MLTYFLHRIVRRLTGRFLFDPSNDARAHRPGCGDAAGFCNCDAHR